MPSTQIQPVFAFQIHGSDQTNLHRHIRPQLREYDTGDQVIQLWVQVGRTKTRPALYLLELEMYDL